MLRVEDLREQHFFLLHFTFLFNAEIGSVATLVRRNKYLTGYLIRLLTCVLQFIAWLQPSL